MDYRYNPTLIPVNGGQFYDVEYNVWLTPTERVSFRTYEEAKQFFNQIPLQ